MTDEQKQLFESLKTLATQTLYSFKEFAENSGVEETSLLYTQLYVDYYNYTRSILFDLSVLDFAAAEKFMEDVIISEIGVPDSLEGLEDE